MGQREILTIIILAINLFLMVLAFKMIVKLSNEGKITRGTKIYFMIISFFIPIIGWMRVKYECYKF